jgi:hypothetical protein
MHDYWVASREAMRIRCPAFLGCNGERAGMGRARRTAESGKDVVAMVELDGGRDGVG